MPAERLNSEAARTSLAGVLALAEKPAPPTLGQDGEAPKCSATGGGRGSPKDSIGDEANNDE